MMECGKARMRNLRFLLVGLVFACSCASIPSQADQVPLTSDTADVRGCSFIRFVQSSIPYASRSEVESDLREEAHDHGANVVLLLTNASGEAYSCAAPAPAWTSPPNSFFPASQMHHYNPNGPYCPPSID
jgi:hypothetical protein